MRRILPILASFLLTALLGNQALAAANDLRITRAESTNTTNIIELVPNVPSGAFGLFGMDGSQNAIGPGSLFALGRMVTMTLGDGMEVFNLNASTSQLRVNNVPIANVTGLQSAIDAKASTSSLASVAFSGSYNDLSNKPSIPSAQIQSDWTQTSSTLSDFIKNKPTLATVATSGAYADLTGKPSLATVATSGAYVDLTGKPTLLSQFTNDSGFVTSTTAPVISVAGKTGTVTLVKADVGLGNVDNTSDANKPVSTAQQTALNLKFNSPMGTTAQYVRGDGTLATLPTTPSATYATATRSLVTGTGATGFQVSATQDSLVTYSVNVSVVATLGNPSGGYVTLEIAPTNSATASDWFEIARCRNDNTVGLLAVQSTQGNGCPMTVSIPAGYYAKLRTVTVSGSPTFTYISGWERKQ